MKPVIRRKPIVYKESVKLPKPKLIIVDGRWISKAAQAKRTSI